MITESNKDWLLNHDEALVFACSSVGCSLWEANQPLIGIVGGVPAYETFNDRSPRLCKKDRVLAWAKKYRDLVKPHTGSIGKTLHQGLVRIRLNVECA